MLIPTAIKKLSSLCDVRFSRYAADGVLLERGENGKPFAVVTDARRMLVATWREKDAGGYEEELNLTHNKDFYAIIPREKWNDAMIFPQKPISACIAVEETATKEKANNITIVAADPGAIYKITTDPIDREFPDPKTIIPNYSDEESTTILVNARLLADTLNSIATDEDESHKVSLTVPHDPCMPIRLHAIVEDKKIETTGAQMPLDNKDTPYEKKREEEKSKASDAFKDAANADVSLSRLFAIALEHMTPAQLRALTTHLQNLTQEHS